MSYYSRAQEHTIYRGGQTCKQLTVAQDQMQQVFCGRHRTLNQIYTDIRREKEGRTILEFLSKKVRF